MDDDPNEDIIEIPIDGVLDLHTFSPKEIKDLIPTYLDECLKLGITEVNIIHGKGKGVLRNIVHSILDKYPYVKSYRCSDNWGSTSVILKVK